MHRLRRRSGHGQCEHQRLGAVGSRPGERLGQDGKMVIIWFYMILFLWFYDVFGGFLGFLVALSDDFVYF